MKKEYIFSKGVRGKFLRSKKNQKTLCIKKTINIPRELLKEAVKISGATTQTMAVIMGLKELVRQKKMEALLKLNGKGKIRFSKVTI